MKWRCHGNVKENDPSLKNTTLDTFSAKCFSLFDHSSAEEAIYVLKLMLAKNCYGFFRFGPSRSAFGPRDRKVVWNLQSDPWHVTEIGRPFEEGSRESGVDRRDDGS